MEESAARLIDGLIGSPGIRVFGYALTEPPTRSTIPQATRLIDIATEVEALIAPLGQASTPLQFRELSRERNRLQCLLLKQHIQNNMSLTPKGPNLIVSFYLPSAGFFAQIIASELGLPHIASARGSDLGRDMFAQDAFAAVGFVINNASAIVTTNETHRSIVQNVLRRENKTVTIYNSLPSPPARTWKPHQRSYIHLVSAGGYSVKKGTQTLLSAVTAMLDDGLPVRLQIVGPTGTGDWIRLRESLAARYGERMMLEDNIPRDQMEPLLLEGDIYCTASLSEGCSNVSMLALGLGVPIVSTRTGALVDLGSNMDHVLMAEPGSPAAYRELLRSAVFRLQNGNLSVDSNHTKDIRERLGSERETRIWVELINECVRAHVHPNVKRSNSHVKPNGSSYDANLKE